MGADYKHRPGSTIHFQSGGASPIAGQGRYFGQWGSLANERTVHLVMPCDGVILGMSCESDLPAGVGESHTYTFRLNAGNTPLVVVIAGAVDTYGENFAEPVVLARGDLIAIACQATNNGAYAATNHTVGLLLKAF